MTGRPAAWIRPAVATVAGAALVAAAFLPWLARGAGSTLRGNELADTLVALDDGRFALPAWLLALVWYLVPAAGAATWVALGVTGRATHRAVRATAVVAAVAAGLVALAIDRTVGLGNAGRGLAVAAIASLALLLAAFVPERPATARHRADR